MSYAPGLAALMTFFLASLAGIPPFGGWFAKFGIFNTLIKADSWAGYSLAGLVVVNSVVAAFYYGRVIRTMISDPATVSVLFSGAEASPEDLAFTVGVVFGCLSPESQVSFIETSLGDTGLTAEQNTCLAEALVADEELLATIVTLGIDPTYEPDATETQALVDMFVGCGVDPSTL